MKKLMLGTALIVLGVSGSAPAVDMQEGSWETTIEMKMEGMPFPMPPMTTTITQCLTKKDMVPNTGTKEQKCDIKNQKIVGNKVTWTVICVDKEGRTEGNGEMTYAGTSYQGVLKTKMTTAGSSETMHSTIKMKGKRIGNCQK